MYKKISTKKHFIMMAKIYIKMKRNTKQRHIFCTALPCRNTKFINKKTKILNLLSTNQSQNKRTL